MSIGPDSARSTYDVVLVTCGAGQLAGAERSIGELAMQLRAEGKNVIMLADRVLEPTVYGTMLAAGDVPVAWVDWHPEKSLWQNIREAWRVFRLYRAPILQFNVSWRRRLWVVPIIARLANSRAKLIATLRTMPDPHHHLPRKIYFGFLPGMRLWLARPKFISWVWGRFSTRVVSVNRDDFPRRMMSDYLFPSERIRVIRNGLPSRGVPLSPRERASIRETAGIPEGHVFLLYAGRLDRGKGVEHLIQILPALPDRYRLALIGVGNVEVELKRQVQELQTGDRVRFLGFQPNPRDWIAATDILVVPSAEGEGLARVVLEGVAERAPIVASSVLGIGEIYESGVHGLQFPPGDLRALRDAILKLGEDPALRARMADAAFRLYQSDYHVDRVREQYLALYEEVRDGSAA